ncbi:MAG: ParB/RepB/Spo0J family partition protein [Oscillospiraceae bacterium]
MGKFNLNQLLNPVSMADSSAAESEETRRPPLKVVSLNIRDLVPSENNFYSVENVEELKTSIEIFGVLQNLTVKPLDNGKYEIISGHRRHKACTELVAEGKTEFEYVPCGIQSERDEIKEQILLIMTNSTARELTDWEKMKQAEELRKNFEILKKREDLPGRVRDLVAEALNTSPTQIARLNAIDNNLTPEFKEEFKEGRIGTSAAYELSGMSEEQQKQAYSDYKEKGGISAKEVKAEKRQTEQFEDSMNAVAEIAEQAPPPAPAEPLTFEEYPETPEDFEEGEESGDFEETQSGDFADFTAEEKAAAAIEFLESKRFSLFAPGEDTRIFDFIIEMLTGVSK